jgi:hypothetical protein
MWHRQADVPRPLCAAAPAGHDAVVVAGHDAVVALYLGVMEGGKCLPQQLLYINNL